MANKKMRYLLSAGSDVMLDGLQNDANRDLIGPNQVGSFDDAPMGSYDAGVYDTYPSQYY